VLALLSLHSAFHNYLVRSQAIWYHWLKSVT